jgi:hypothetical protein
MPISQTISVVDFNVTQHSINTVAVKGNLSFAVTNEQLPVFSGSPDRPITLRVRFTWGLNPLHVT